MSKSSVGESVAGELPEVISGELRKIAGVLVRELHADPTLVGACAADVGIQLMARSYTPDQIAAWLEAEARELREIGPQLAQRKSGQQLSFVTPEAVVSRDAQAANSSGVPRIYGVQD
jgi:hypothetical protein